MIVNILMILMAVGSALGGLDYIFGNRLGLGAKFEEGFHLLGPLAMVQAGIICLSVPFAQMLGPAVRSLYLALGQDPAMFGSLLAIDMGGYQIAMEFAQDTAVGRFSGIVAASMLGCTVVYTLPVGMGLLSGAKRDAFSKGILYGLIALPCALLVGALLSGLPVFSSLALCLPVILLSGAMILGLLFIPTAVSRFFRGLAWVIRAVAATGIILGSVSYMTGWEILPGLIPLTEAMQTVCAICIVLLGSLPMAELLNRALRKPLASFSKKARVSEAALVNLLVCLVSVTPALASLKTMNDREITLNTAFSVCAASAFAVHLGFALAVEQDLAIPMLVSKLLGGALAILVMLAAENRMYKRK